MTNGKIPMTKSYSCPTCSFDTHVARELLQHLSMAPLAHAILVELGLAEEKIRSGWADLYETDSGCDCCGLESHEEDHKP